MPEERFLDRGVDFRIGLPQRQRGCLMGASVGHDTGRLASSKGGARMKREYEVMWSMARMQSEEIRTADNTHG